eukprot:scaffold7358_cov252-Pinguiococcus_pyrenoidosus.AAC.20
MRPQVGFVSVRSLRQDAAVSAAKAQLCRFPRRHERQRRLERRERPRRARGELPAPAQHCAGAGSGPGLPGRRWRPPGFSRVGSALADAHELRRCDVDRDLSRAGTGVAAEPLFPQASQCAGSGRGALRASAGQSGLAALFRRQCGGGGASTGAAA